MFKFLLCGLMAAAFPYHLVAQENSALQTYLQELSPEISVAVLAQDESGKVLFFQNEDKILPSASIIKIPILVELFFQLESSSKDWAEVHVLKEGDKVGGTGTLQAEPEGTSLTVEHLAKKMIIESDNTATNILIDLVGMENVNKRMRALGFSHTQLNRKMMDFEAINRGDQNYTSAKETNDLLLMLYNGNILMPLSRNLVMELLFSCEDKSAIPSQLPSELLVANKTGALTGLRADSGIIVGEKAIILSVFVEKSASAEEAEKIIGTVAKLIYDSATAEPQAVSWR